jgi:hypothetical protein
MTARRDEAARRDEFSGSAGKKSASRSVSRDRSVEAAAGELAADEVASEAAKQ